MSAARDLDGLIRFILRDEIRGERLAEVLVEQLGPAHEEFDVDFEEQGDLIRQSWPPRERLTLIRRFEELRGLGYEGATMPSAAMPAAGRGRAGP